MNEHPQDALARFDQMDDSDPERKLVAAHLEGCEICRAVVEAYREIDRAVNEPARRLPAMAAIENRLAETSRKMRRAAKFMIAVAVGQLVVGAIAIALLVDEAIVAAVGAGVFLTEGVLFVGLALHSRRQSFRYAEVAGSWERGRTTWWNHLVADARASLIAAVSSGIMLVGGAVMAATSATMGRPVNLAAGTLLVGVGAMGLVVHIRRRRRARHELRAFDDLFPLRG